MTVYIYVFIDSKVNIWNVGGQQYSFSTQEQLFFVKVSTFLET